MHMERFLREEITQRTEVEKDWLHSWGKSLRNFVLLSNLDFMWYYNIFLCGYLANSEAI